MGPSEGLTCLVDTPGHPPGEMRVKTLRGEFKIHTLPHGGVTQGGVLKYKQNLVQLQSRGSGARHCLGNPALPLKEPSGLE